MTMMAPSRPPSFKCIHRKRSGTPTSPPPQQNRICVFKEAENPPVGKVGRPTKPLLPLTTAASIETAHPHPHPRLLRSPSDNRSFQLSCTLSRCSSHSASAAAAGAAAVCSSEPIARSVDWEIPPRNRREYRRLTLSPPVAARVSAGASLSEGSAPLFFLSSLPLLSLSRARRVLCCCCLSVCARFCVAATAAVDALRITVFSSSSSSSAVHPPRPPPATQPLSPGDIGLSGHRTPSLPGLARCQIIIFTVRKASIFPLSHIHSAISPHQHQHFGKLLISKTVLPPPPPLPLRHPRLPSVIIR